MHYMATRNAIYPLSSRIEFIRFLDKKGGDSAKIIVEQEISGGDRQLRDLESIIRNQITSNDSQQQDYPYAALFELAYCAFFVRNHPRKRPIKIHWYADCVEIISSDFPFNSSRARGFNEFENSNAWDFLTAKAGEYRKCDPRLISRFHLDVLIATNKALAENGNPPLRYKIGGNWVSILIMAKE